MQLMSILKKALFSAQEYITFQTDRPLNINRYMKLQLIVDAIVNYFSRMIHLTTVCYMSLLEQHIVIYMGIVKRGQAYIDAK